MTDDLEEAQMRHGTLFKRLRLRVYDLGLRVDCLGFRVGAVGLGFWGVKADSHRVCIWEFGEPRSSCAISVYIPCIPTIPLNPKPIVAGKPTPIIVSWDCWI